MKEEKENDSAKQEKPERDVRLVFEKKECQECHGKGVIKLGSNGKSYEKCKVCNGIGDLISYKIKEIEWFKKF